MADAVHTEANCFPEANAEIRAFLAKCAIESQLFELNVGYISLPKHNLHFKIRPNNWGALAEYCLGVETEKIGDMSEFIVVNRRNLLKKVVFVFAPGISTTDYLWDLTSTLPKPMTGEETKLPVLQKFFGATWPTISRSVTKLPCSIYEEVLTRDLVEYQSETLSKKKKPKKGKPISYSSMLVDKMTMEMLKYPLCPEGPDWLVIPSTVHPAVPVKESNLLAVDCEMVETNGHQTELARIAVSDHLNRLVYHSYVKPAGTVTNYKTQFSGITKELLEGVTTTLKDVQIWFATHLRLGNVLVGHALFHDLRVLKIVCHDVIDTVCLYQHPVDGNAKLPSLKLLAQTYLAKDIQNSVNGHDPFEDASMCMDLTLLKGKKGRDFGCKTTRNIAERLNAVKKTTAIVDRHTQLWAQGEAKTIKICRSDDEVVSETIKLSKSHDLTVCRLNEFAREYNPLSERCAMQLNNQIEKLYKELPKNTLMVVFSDRGPCLPLQQQLEHKFQVLKTRPLSRAESKELKRVSQDAAVSATFVTVTGVPENFGMEDEATQEELYIKQLDYLESIFGYGNDSDDFRYESPYGDY